MGDGEDAGQHDPLRPALPRSPAYRQHRGKGRGHQSAVGNHAPPEQESLEHSQECWGRARRASTPLKAAFQVKPTPPQIAQLHRCLGEPSRSAPVSIILRPGPHLSDPGALIALAAAGEFAPPRRADPGALQISQDRRLKSIQFTSARIQIALRDPKPKSWALRLRLLMHQMLEG